MILLRPEMLAFLGPILEPLRKGETGGRVVLGPPPVPNRKEFPYQGVILFQGMRLLIENAKGSTRSGTAPDGRKWSVKMSAHYGEFDGTRGVDGDPVDVFVGEDPDAPNAYVIHRKHPGTEVYDEDKVVVGCRTLAEAEKLFYDNYDCAGQLGGTTIWPMSELREYLAHPGHEGRRLDQPQRVRILLRKSVPIKDRPGLHLDPTSHRWTRDGEEAPKEHVVAHDFGSGPRTYKLAPDGSVFWHHETAGWRPVNNLDLRDKVRAHFNPDAHRPVVTRQDPREEPSRPDPGYKMTHRPAKGAPANDLRSDETVPKDILDHPERYTGYRRELAEFWPKLKAAQGKPDAKVTIYRALPKDHGGTVNAGDWVSLSRSYAEAHAKGEEGWHVVGVEVPASAVHWAGDDLMEWGYWGDRLGDARAMLKAVIRTPMSAEGKVDYDAVPVGASIWVRVTDPHSPLHGRPILLTKRPDHQFALTGGSASKQIQARRHLVVNAGRAKTSKADEAALAARAEVEAKNAPIREQQRALRREARGAQRDAEDQFMAALGVERRGLSKSEKADVHARALEHATGAGLSGRDAESFARHMADGIARKEREFHLEHTARRLELARHVAGGLDHDEAVALAGPDPAPVEYKAPPIDPETWSKLAEPARESLVQAHLDEQGTAHQLQEMEDSRFETPAGEEGGGPTLRDGEEHFGPVDVLAHDHERETSAAPEAAELPGAQAATPTDQGPEEGHAPFVAGTAPSPAPLPPAAGPVFKVGAQAAPTPVLDQEHARMALEHFRAYASARKAERELGSSLSKPPETESAGASAVEDLRLRLSAVDDAELNGFLDEYRRQNLGGVPDGAFYGAMSPHWNDDVGNKLAGAATRGAASAITGLVGEEVGARYDVQRLVDALGPEAAAMAVVHRLREDLGDGFGAWVDKLRDHNATNQHATERRALQRHHQLQQQAEALEAQVKGGDLTSRASVEVLRARNLVEQRENLGGALGSLQASAALYHFADQARGAARKKQDVTINVGSKVALADKLRRLGKVRATTGYHPTLGYQIHTDTEALKKYVGRTQADRTSADRWHAVKYDTSGIEPDAEGREWVPGYHVPGFRSHFGGPETLPTDQRHLAGQPIHLLADQRNNIEWLHGSGGGLVTMRTGGGKTVTSVGVAAKMLHENPSGRHLRVVPDGREEQWATEIRNFSTIPVVVLPGTSTQAERGRLLSGAPAGSVVVVGHTNAGRYDHEALATAHPWDSIGIDEPQELRAKSGSGKLSAGAKRIFKIPAKNRHALTATPATDHPVEAFDVVNWARPGTLGFRTRFQRAFDGFGAGTNAQDAALERSLYRELEPHVSGERLVMPHYGVEHADNRVRMSAGQLAKQREIEGRADAAVQTAGDNARAKKQAGVRGYAERSYAALNRDAKDRALRTLAEEHRLNLSGGDTEHNPKLAALQRAVGTSDPSHRHVVFVDSPEQRRAATALLERMGRKVKNITASARGDTVKRGGVEVGAIEERKRDWKAAPGSVLLIDRTSASGHNLAEGDHLHVLGNPDDAAQLLQAQGRLGRTNRVGDFAVHTYRYEDSPFEHARWNRLDRQLKILRATAPGMFVEGQSRPQAALAKGSRTARVLLRAVIGSR